MRPLKGYNSEACQKAQVERRIGLEREDLLRSCLSLAFLDCVFMPGPHFWLAAIATHSVMFKIYMTPLVACAMLSLSYVHSISSHKCTMIIALHGSLAPDKQKIVEEYHNLDIIIYFITEVKNNLVFESNFLDCLENGKESMMKCIL